MRLVRTTVDTKRQADVLAKALVEEKLAVCVHVVPLTSTYQWKGELERTDEYMVEARVLPGRTPAVRARMLQGHPYEVPMLEVIESSVQPAYLHWAGGGA